MKRIALASLAVLAGGGALLAWGTASGQGLRAPFSVSDAFDAGLSNPLWSVKQQVNGTVDVVPGRDGPALRARTGPKVGDTVAKAALIARPAPMSAGTRLRVGFDLYAPIGSPVDSLQIVDIECATCGEGGNPGVRLYLRRGRLRIDRSKIGIRNAWTRDDAPVVVPGRWHRVELVMDLSDDDRGGARVTLDGVTVLDARGATLAHGYADRVQVGITANSNPFPAELWFDNVRVSAQ